MPDLLLLDNAGRVLTSSWRHHICERCWWELPGNHEYDDGQTIVRFPVRVVKSHPSEQFCFCCMCAQPTISGIFIMKDPATMTCEMRGTHGSVGVPVIDDVDEARNG